MLDLAINLLGNGSHFALWSHTLTVWPVDSVFDLSYCLYLLFLFCSEAGWIIFISTKFTEESYTRWIPSWVVFLCKLVWLFFALLIANIGIYTLLHHNCVSAFIDYIIYLTTVHVIYISHDNILCSCLVGDCPSSMSIAWFSFFGSLSASDNKCIGSGSYIEIYYNLLAVLFN